MEVVVVFAGVFCAGGTGGLETDCGGGGAGDGTALAVPRGLVGEGEEGDGEGEALATIGVDLGVAGVGGVLAIPLVGGAEAGCGDLGVDVVVVTVRGDECVAGDFADVVGAGYGDGVGVALGLAGLCEAVEGGEIEEEEEEDLGKGLGE